MSVRPIGHRNSGQISSQVFPVNLGTMKRKPASRFLKYMPVANVADGVPMQSAVVFARGATIASKRMKHCPE